MRQIPEEFINFKTQFEIMEKCQHYGMSTRLLDVTTNPLVALYFACSPMEDSDDNEQGIEADNIYGVVYYKAEVSNFYYNSFQTLIISALAKYDMGSGMEIDTVIQKLFEEGIIDRERRERWSKKDGINEFIKILDGVYTVLPILNNRRLINQSGAFLLPGKFSISNTSDDIMHMQMYKSTCSLRDEFEKEFFCISNENKGEILKELEAYNINLGNMFPETEYQLKYIQKIFEEQKSMVPSYEGAFEETQNIQTSENRNSVDTFNKSKAKKAIESLLYNEDTVDTIVKFMAENASIDWNKRDSVASKMRIEISKILMSKENKGKEEVSDIAEKIVKLVIEAHEK